MHFLFPAAVYNVFLMSYTTLLNACLIFASTFPPCAIYKLQAKKNVILFWIKVPCRLFVFPEGSFQHRNQTSHGEKRFYLYFLCGIQITIFLPITTCTCPQNEFSFCTGALSLPFVLQQTNFMIKTHES